MKTKQPKTSELFRAAARGVMEPYNFRPPPGLEGQSFVSPAFDSRSYDLAKSIAGAFHAIAAVYEKIEETEPQ